MRSLAFVLMTPLLACSATVQRIDPTPPDGPTEIDGGDSPLMPPAHGFQLVSPTLGIANGEESTYCYYFHTPNTGELSIQSWTSRMTPGVHEMILYLTTTDQQPPGTMSPTNCGIAKSSSIPVWTYSAQSSALSPIARWQLPGDDGAGNPIGQLIRANQSGFLQIHYLNTTGSAVQAHVELNADAYDDALPVTLAGPFVTFRRTIQIGPGSEAQPATGEADGSCPVPVDRTGAPVKFFMMTTHTYRQGVHTFVNDGTSKLFDSTSWLQPGATTWGRPFYSFKSGMLNYQCEYQNRNSYSIQMGDNPLTNELCMSISFYFPADRAAIAIGHYCLDSATVY